MATLQKKKSTQGALCLKTTKSDADQIHTMLLLGLDGSRRREHEPKPSVRMDGQEE